MFFFFRQDRLPNISTEILIIRVERKKKFEIFFSTTQNIDGNTDRGQNKFQNIFYFYFYFFRLDRLPNTNIDGNTDNKGRKKKKIPNFFSTTQHIDGNTDNKGRTNFKIFFFNFFFRLDRLPNTQTSTEILIIRVGRKKNFEFFFSTTQQNLTRWARSMGIKHKKIHDSSFKG